MGASYEFGYDRSPNPSSTKRSRLSFGTEVASTFRPATGPDASEPSEDPCRYLGHTWPDNRPSLWARMTRRPEVCRRCHARRLVVSRSAR